jgi:DNA helicase IV
MARLVCKGDTKLFERVLGPNGKNIASRLADEERSVANGKRLYAWSDADLPIVAEIMYLLDGSNGRQNFSHVLVDEAQDLTRMQCRVVSQFISAGQLTLVGDMNQATRTGNLRSWEKLGEEFGAANPKIMSLLQNYRVPQNIYDYARQYLTENDRIDTPTCDIEGGKVTLLEVGQSEAIQILEETVVSLVTVGGRIAVITESDVFRESVENMNLKNVVVLTPEESKGLEVDHSVLIQPNRWYKDSGRLRNLMYVTLTRATKTVTIIQHDPERFGIFATAEFAEI